MQINTYGCLVVDSGNEGRRSGCSQILEGGTAGGLVNLFLQELNPFFSGRFCSFDLAPTSEPVAPDSRIGRIKGDWRSVETAPCPLEAFACVWA